MVGMNLPRNMSDEPTPSPDLTPEPATEVIPRARRISNPRPRKVAKVKEAAIEPAALPPAEAAPEIIEELPPSPPENEWPEPDAATAGQAPPSESAKRKRRRRKGKGKGDGSQNPPSHPPENAASSLGESTSEYGTSEANLAPRPENQPASPPKPNTQLAPRPKIDPELLTKMAWKIYLAEVSEEGVALIGDNDAKDLSRRCFRLAEIFIEEQLRRR